jgi:hypothetical protein
MPVYFPVVLGNWQLLNFVVLKLLDTGDQGDGDMVQRTFELYS